MSESAGNESDLSFSEFDAEQEVDPNDLHDDNVSSKALSVPETVQRLIFQSSNELEGTDWREEFRMINSKLLQKAQEKHLSLTAQNFNRADLLRILFEPLAHLLTNSDYGIFTEESPNERLANFGFFMATLNILKVSGLSFAELDHPSFQALRAGLKLPMPITTFKETLKRLAIECRNRKGQLFFNLEKVFSKSDVQLFYSPSIVLGADDDKMPTRSDALSEDSIKKTGGRTSRSFPTSDDMNTAYGCFTLARLTQKKEQTSFQSIEQFLKWVKEVNDLTFVPNLFLLDRGYDRASDLFAQWFGTLKRGPHCIYVEPTSRRPCKYNNQVKILLEGLQVNYEYQVPTFNGKSQYQSAFLSNGNATYMTAPAGHESFGSNLIGVWLAVHIRPSLLTD